MARSIQNRGLGMKRMTTVSAFVVVLVLMAFIPGAAQAQMGGQMQMGSQTVQQDQPTGQQPIMGGAMMGQGMMCPMMSGGMGMMSMMPHMMGGQMGRSGMGMMRMMGGGQMDPKAMGRMLQLRGDILKAIGEVMVKHGKAMEEAK